MTDAVVGLGPSRVLAVDSDARDPDNYPEWVRGRLAGLLAALADGKPAATTGMTDGAPLTL